MRWSYRPHQRVYAPPHTFIPLCLQDWLLYIFFSPLVDWDMEERWLVYVKSKMSMELELLLSDHLYRYISNSNKPRFKVQ